MEIQAADGVHEKPISGAEWKVIREHLAKVFVEIKLKEQDYFKAVPMTFPNQVSTTPNFPPGGTVIC